MTEELVSKLELLEAAQQLGYGEARSLGRTFVDWQTAGLVGPYEHKATRHGGEGLWHPTQQVLFQACLRNRGNGVGIVRLANLPVGGWLVGMPGITLTQAQRAWGTWAGARLSSMDRRSKVGRDVDREVSRLASPAATVNQRRALRGAFDHMLDGLGAVSRDTFSSSFVGCVAPEQESSDDQRQFARIAYDILSLRFLAVAHRDTLAGSSAEEVRRFWEWARELWQKALSCYQADWGSMREGPDIDKFFERPDMNNIMSLACPNLATLFGLGISVQAHSHPLTNAAPPPRVTAFTDAHR